MKRQALSLLELLIVLAIIAVLTGLLLPVLTRARWRAQQIPCASNLRQLHLAWTMYCSDYDGTYPLHAALVFSYVRNREVFACPVDSFGGAVRYTSTRLGTPVSYFYLLSDDVNSFRNIFILRAIDANHGVFYCVLHGKPCPLMLHGNAKHAFDGLVLRIRVDGSLQNAWVGYRCFRLPDGGYHVARPQWAFVSDTPCPEKVLGAFCGSTEGQEVSCHPCGSVY